MRKRVLGEQRAAHKGKGHCAICGEEVDVCSAIPFRFFTVGKQGFGPMGHEEMVWKYAPVCEECAKWLYVAQSYLQEHLTTRVAGKAAYLIPDLEPGAADIEGSFIHYLWKWHELMKGKIVPDKDFPLSEEEHESAFSSLFEGLVEDYDKQFRDKPPFRSASLIFYQFYGRKFIFLYVTSEILPHNLQRASRRLKKLRELLRQKVLGKGGIPLSRRLRSDFKFVGEAWQ
ncbi:MAG: TM1802 family CRISPR-associated protein [Candidatus Fervidibacter sp.]|uniref:TM1802 family CRISPR-associated protein n=1 Tax=Candidatus Fervidibacter sp. TaxID=3100871 RepID=UPI0040491012